MGWSAWWKWQEALTQVGSERMEAMTINWWPPSGVSSKSTRWDRFRRAGGLAYLWQT